MFIILTDLRNELANKIENEIFDTYISIDTIDLKICIGTNIRAFILVHWF